MFDVLHNGSYVSVGAPWQAEAVGFTDKEADGHKVTPLDETYYNDPDIGEETNAYADIPERVRGEYDVPSLDKLAPQMFTAGQNLSPQLLEGIAWKVREEFVEEGSEGLCQEVAEGIVDELHRLGFKDAFVNFGQFEGLPQHPHAWAQVDGWMVDATRDQFAQFFDEEKEEELLDNPVLIKKIAAELPEEDVDRTEEQLARIREEVKDVEYAYEITDSHRGELFGEVGARINGKPVGFVQFSEYGNVHAEGLQEGGDVPYEIHIKYVYVAPLYRRMGIGTGMYKKIQQEFPGEKIVGSGTTERGGKFRRKLTERGVLASKPKISASQQRLEELAWEFRQKQEDWFEWEDDKMCFREQCYSIAPLLAKFLTEHGIPAEPWHSYYVTDDGEEHNHWWVVAGDKVVDVTADQFYEGEPDQGDYRVVVTDQNDEHYSRPRRKFKNKQADTDILIQTEYGNAYGDLLVADELPEWFDRNYAQGYEEFVEQLQTSHGVIAVLDGMDIMPEARGEGRGKDLLARFVEKADSMGASAIVAIVDTAQKQRSGFDLTQWYERQGFKRAPI